ncbi:hypothetical protein BC938DRAFT_472001 [Jimgerdemannia flammicorona]|uniref:Uncharacterized protein n=1 Tax=Jimgerdemannia flammicorona TaxID=994334 RepID=A0A433QZV9_9FUNG|nr:hypothetical protein BC938DRAFT_472001 [Jimgerdemannia flammicorona]
MTSLPPDFFYRALSYVFIFQKENPYDLDRYFDDELWDDIIQIFANTIKVGIVCKNPNYPK